MSIPAPDSSPASPPSSVSLAGPSSPLCPLDPTGPPNRVPCPTSLGLANRAPRKQPAAPPCPPPPTTGKVAPPPSQAGTPRWLPPLLLSRTRGLSPASATVSPVPSTPAQTWYPWRPRPPSSPTSWAPDPLAHWPRGSPLSPLPCRTHTRHRLPHPRPQQPPCRSSSPVQHGPPSPKLGRTGPGLTRGHLTPRKTPHSVGPWGGGPQASVSHLPVSRRPHSQGARSLAVRKAGPQP